MSIILSVSQLKKSIGPRTLFEGLSFGLDAGSRVGLVGPNGAGKSSLFRCLAGLDTAESGKIIWSNNIHREYVSQSPVYDQKDTLEDFIYKNKRLSIDDYEVSAKMWEYFSRLNMGEVDLNQPFRELSGGGQKKAQIIRAFLAEPQMLLMDEPTNHLDVESIMWLEDFLKSRPSIGYFIISHDRLFLQNVVDEMIELNPSYREGYIRTKGGYAEYLELKNETVRSQKVQQQRQENDLRRETAWLRRGAKARQTKQTARQNAAYQLQDDVALLKGLNRSRDIEIEVGNTGRSPKKLIEAENITATRGGKNFFENLNLLVHRRTRLGLLGKNGSGKSTLIQALIGEAPFEGNLQLTTGTVKKYDELKVNYFEQKRIHLEQDETLYKNLCPEGDYVYVQGVATHAKSYLDRFNFRRDQHDLKVRELSGGEQNRLMIAKLMTQSCQLMVLDEPTNDLDFETLESLRLALENFDGAILLVSHDRAFLDEVCTEILYFPEGENAAKLVKFSSFLQWQDWKEENQQLLKKKNAQEAAAKKTSQKLSYKEQLEYDKMESIIAVKEKELSQAQGLLTCDEVVTNAQRLMEVSQQVHDLESEIEKLYSRWQLLEQKKS